MKNFLWISFLIFYSSQALSSELLFSYQISEKNHLKIEKQYPGEPVNTPRRLIVTQTCDGKKSEIYNKKECDFDEFRLSSGELKFTIRYYEPSTGLCESPETTQESVLFKAQCP